MTGDIISRSELLLEMAAGCVPLFEKGISGVTGDESTIYDYIKNAPAIDAAPVVHGRWISHFDRSECSVCGGICWADSASTYDYCPNCGAKMDKEEEKHVSD